jgi:ABC-type multidrug transport system permease subunit
MYMTLFIVVGLWICGIFVSLFQCDPVDQAWKIDPNRKCINYVNYLYASSAVNVFTDVVLCVLPIPYLWKLSKSSPKNHLDFYSFFLNQKCP